ncbi:MAG: carboxymuconolactone decarboxylase family protein [Deltaproteobacteria bacterium]|nr:carboxymuconolactone decarboxylase family protein [Deltaproteobacteria bacterium]
MKTNQKIAKHIPETIKTFMVLHEKTMETGALDKKQKELIAAGIAVAAHCRACIYIFTHRLPCRQALWQKKSLRPHLLASSWAVGSYI